ncbi:MAG: GldM family protein [Flavisolibacter sp.]
MKPIKPFAARAFCKLLIASFLSLLSAITFSQTVSVAPVKMNVLYIGVDNPISVATSAADDNRVTISIDGGGGAATKLEPGPYNVKVTWQTNECIVNVYVDGKLAGSSKFRVRVLPEPFATVGGFESGAYVPSDAFRKQAGVGVYVANSPFDIKYEVVGFTLVLPTEKGKISMVECQGNVFSEKAKEYLQQNAKPGDIVTIENIRVKGPNGQIKLPALIYNIK